MPIELTWRRFMLACLLSSVGAMGVAGCTDNDEEAKNDITRNGVPGVLIGDDASVPPSCVLSPEQLDDAAYAPLGLVRNDVREQRPGVTLRLQLIVLNSRTCTPLANAAVDVWSADAQGSYSASQGAGATSETYLRGVQLTDTEGQAFFTTIYPGWEPGRANHIHAKVHVAGFIENDTYADGESGHVTHDAQLFLPQSLDDEIAKLSPYVSNRTARTALADDESFVQNDGKESMLTVTGSVDAGFTAVGVMIVDPDTARR